MLSAQLEEYAFKKLMEYAVVDGNLSSADSLNLIH